MTVTLITGDKATVVGEQVSVDPAPGREHIQYFTQAGGGEISVMPADAAKLVATGKLDERLFDVSYLIKEGFADHQTATVPLLVKGRPDRVRPVTNATGARVTRELPRTQMAAVAVDKKADQGRWWTKLATTSAPAGKTRGRSVLPTGVEKVWLDAKVRVTLDQSVPQIGAPAAWQAGYDGTGTTVAVLDTGVDATHPDLTGKVHAEQNFTPEPSAADGHGHGTHVASTIVGTGAASGGQYKGVAPGAKVLNGKVCNRGGRCATSSILAGMEWAAASGADVVNLSLGGTDTPGIDPMEEAVNRLTAQTGTLFVIAAGNSGAGGAHTVGSPGSADAALTVAAVDKADQLALFSSRGPRVGDHALKPDLAAPGVAIAAARAAGTAMGTPVNDRYTRANGTSMATPHVAGAAALLAQAEPDLTGQELKTTLMSTAHALDNIRPFDVGTGRVDVARAVTQQVSADTPSVSFGLVKWPHGVDPVAKQVTFRNSGDADVTLDLQVAVQDEEGTAAPDGLFSLDTTEVTVPAGGTATATVTMAPRGDGSHAGTYGGRITATDNTGIAVQTVFGATLEIESYDLTIDILDHTGQPDAGLFANVQSYDTGKRWYYLVPGATVRLPVGSYGITGFSLTDEQPLDSVAQLAYPEVELTRDTVLTLDARQSRPVDIEVPDRPTARQRSLNSEMHLRLPANQGYMGYGVSVYEPEDHVGYWRVFVGSQGEAAESSDGLPKFFHAVVSQWEEPQIRLDVTGRGGFPVDVFYAEDTYFNARTLLLGRHRMDVVDGGAGTTADLTGVRVRGNLVMLTIPPEQDDEVLQRVDNVRAAGGRAVLLNRPGYPQPALMAAPSLPTLMTSDEAQRARLLELVERGDPTVVTHGIQDSPYRYSLAFTTEGRMPTSPDYKARDRQLGTTKVTRHQTGPESSGQTQYRQVRIHGRGIPGWIPWWHRLRGGPYVQTEYFTPGEWMLTSRDYGGADRRDAFTRIHAGKNEPQSLFAGVMSPSMATRPWEDIGFNRLGPGWVFRDGNTLDILAPMLTDTGATHATLAERPTTGTIRLYRNGALVGEASSPVGGVATLPADQARYRLEMEVDTTAAGPSYAWTHSTRVSAAWAFDSAATEQPTVLPLLNVRFEPKLDQYNRAPGNTAFKFPVRVEHQAGAQKAEVTHLEVQASYDDGESWERVKVRRVGGREWTATVDNPRNGFVTLRGVARDARDNLVDVTVERAYSVR